eukprot:9126082-Ditylum_brightwellii.AAC.1
MALSEEAFRLLIQYLSGHAVGAWSCRSVVQRTSAETIAPAYDLRPAPLQLTPEPVRILSAAERS